MISNFVATSREALRKVEPNSTSRNGFCNLFPNVFTRCKVYKGACKGGNNVAEANASPFAAPGTFAAEAKMFLN